MIPPRLFAVFLSFAILISTQLAHADLLPEPWQSKRDAANAISDKACTGDPAAVAQAHQLIADGDVIMLYNTGWLKENCDDFKSYSEEEMAAFDLRSALAGYPLALSRYGTRLIKGGVGTPQDVKTGIAMMDQAANAGFGFAAYYLAEHYTFGTYFPADPAKARAYLAIAKEEGIVADAINELSGEIAEVEAVMAPTAGNDQFAALAVSIGDGGFGFAHDYPTQSEARDRATDECQSRGGSNCDIKLVGRGKGCMAYHSAGESATAHGWAIGATQGAISSRAAQECRTRNGDVSCGNTSWVCNDRTEAALDVVFEAPMPDPIQAGEGCYVKLLKFCENVMGVTNSEGAYKYIVRIHAFPTQRIVFPGCGGDDSNLMGIIGHDSEWERHNDDGDIPGPMKTKIAAILKDYKATVLDIYPGCGYRGTRMFIEQEPQWHERLGDPAWRENAKYFLVEYDLPPG